MRNSKKPNLLTGRRLPAKLAKQLAGAQKEYELAGKKYTAVIRELMQYVPRSKGAGLRKR
jgi:hypothetical protein